MSDEEIKGKIEKIDGKIDILDSRLDKIDNTLVKQNADLVYHIKRTTLLEDHVKLVEKSIVPIKTHVDRVDGALKLLGLLSLILGIVGTILKLANVI